MNEREGKSLVHPATERAADEAFSQGDHRKAAMALFDGIKQTYLHHPSEYHHFALKSVAAPFYDLAYRGPNDERVNEAYNVYGWTGDLIDNELAEIMGRHGSKREQSRRIGRMSELVVFGLLARAFDDETCPVPLPASRDDDVSPHDAADFYLTSLADTSEFIRLQVKTRVSAEDLQAYQGSEVRLVGLSDIDPHGSNPVNPDSLARRIIRDLDGSASEDDEKALDSATVTLLQTMRKPINWKTAG